jgi:NSS family neurotransmitter:Na+ symporter|tara:strand:+ start:1689 stop:3038 length:1350 start_codon:yes stop_codon:yes gene_type:complete
MWGSRFAFVLAAAGSAVGLGNIWGFPTQVGRGGGAAFVIVYLFCIVMICAPILVAEIVLGRRSRQSPVGAFKFLSPGTRWWWVGAVGVVTSVGIVAFYSVIGGWTIAYVWFAASGALGGGGEAAGDFFTRFTANGWQNVLCTFIFLGMAAAANAGGVRAGIERVTTALMPALLALLVLLAVRSLTLPGAAEGLAYYMRPDFSQAFNMTIVGAALGQAFFSLSLGNGAMLTYGSYLRRSDGIGRSVLMVVALDTSIALLAGLIIFPAGFSIVGFDPASSGPGLIFAVLPQLFATLAGGTLFGGAFFILLVMAALTSAISLLEVPVAHVVDRWGWSRPKAVGLVAGSAFLLSIPCALGNGAVESLSNLAPAAWGGNFLGVVATICNNFSLPITGMLMCIFVGYVWRVDRAVEELLADNAWFPNPKLWGLLVRYVSPLAIASILLGSIMAVL